MKLLGCGSNGNYQLGNNTDQDFNHLVVSKFLINGQTQDSIDLIPKQIVCGGNHTFILFTTGQAFSCGDNTYGQCGHPIQELNIPIFTQVEGTWSHISCGWEFSVLVNDQNDIFVCGLGLMGELGLGKDHTKTGLTWLMNKPIQKITSSINFTILQDQSGQYYGWGNSKKGQLFIAKSNIWQPTKLELPLNDVLHFYVTKDSTILQTNTKLISFGKTDLDIPLPVQVESVKTMWSSVHYKTNDTIISVGKNTHGQHFPQHQTQVQGDFDFTLGSEHGLIRDSNNNIFAWGWGEHGNCGHSTEPGHNQITFASLNHLYTASEYLHMAAGCATTFIIIA